MDGEADRNLKVGPGDVPGGAVESSARGVYDDGLEPTRPSTLALGDLVAMKRRR
ncbi:MAG: hypothetical protein ACYSVY_14280 [Planctomycetota bacterium]